MPDVRLIYSTQTKAGLTLPNSHSTIARPLARRTITKEFYEVTENFFELSELKDELLEWEGIYNIIRPHQVLGYLTPLKFLEQRKEYLERRMCHQSYERVHLLDIPYYSKMVNIKEGDVG